MRATARSMRATGSLLEVRRYFLLLQIGGEIFLDRNIDEGYPERRLRGVGIEMLVLDSFGLHGQQHQVAFLPVLALAIDHRIALAFEHVDHETALVAMLAGARLDVVDEHAPLLQRRLLERHRIEEVLELALARLEPFLLGAVDHHGPGEIALGERLALRHHPLVWVFFKRRPLALAHAFDFSHCSAPHALGRYSGASSSCSKPQPRSTVTPSSQFGSAATNLAGLFGSALKC